jgi:DNA-directed RNA polymerase subunit alpha
LSIIQGNGVEMSMKNLNVIAPSEIKSVPSSDPGSLTVVLEPFSKGLGLTIAVALRRIIISSIEGYAPYKVIISDVLHEYSSIENIQEDVVALLMNIKQLNIKCTRENEDEFVLELNKKGKGLVSGKDLKLPGFVEILNPDMPLAHITGDQTLSLRIHVKKDVGYKTAAQLKQDLASDDEVGAIFLDCVFSPIRKVSYRIENARLGNRTDLDKLILNIKTDTTVDPIDIIRRSATILQYQLAAFSDIKEQVASETKQPEVTYNLDFDLGIASLRFTVRAVNCLKGEGIEWVGQLVQCKESELLKTPNLGRKSLAEIKNILSKHDLTLGMDTDGWVPPSSGSSVAVDDQLFPAGND